MGRTHEALPEPAQIVDMGLQFGPYGASRDAAEGAPLSLAALVAAPHGVDLGPLRECLPARIFHADKMIHAAPEELLAELARFALALSSEAAAPEEHAKAAKSGARDALVLIGRRHVRSNNSWLHNSRRLIKGKARHELLMHPDDAKARDLESGARVCVRSRVGEVTVDMRTSDEVMRGVVSLPHGFGHDREGVPLGVASSVVGASNNDLTDESLLDMSGNAALNGVPVTVSRR